MSGRWLFKTEPEAYSWQQLERDGRTTWDGVRNALALKHLAAAEKGDEIIVYHTGREKAAVGIAEVIRAPYPDPRGSDPRSIVVDIRAVRPLAHPVTLTAMRADRKLAGFDLLRLPRLSVMPVSREHWAAILEMAKG